jgi:hypothetical protein
LGYACGLRTAAAVALADGGDRALRGCRDGESKAHAHTRHVHGYDYSEYSTDLRIRSLYMY